MAYPHVTSFHWYLVIIENPQNMLHPGPRQVLRQAPMTRKRKRDSEATNAESASAEDKDKTDSDSTSKETSEHASEPTSEQTAKQESVRGSEPPEAHVPEHMHVDAESEGDGQEVETMLQFSQSCTISDPSVEHVAERRATPPAVREPPMELQYPESSDVEEPMDVDSLSHAGPAKKPLSASKGEKPRAAEEPIVIDDASQADMTLAANESEGAADGPNAETDEDPKAEDGEDQSTPVGLKAFPEYSPDYPM